MLYKEYEELTGTSPNHDVYENLIERMYSGTNLDKRTFVTYLNKKALADPDLHVEYHEPWYDKTIRDMRAENQDLYAELIAKMLAVTSEAVKQKFNRESFKELYLIARELEERRILSQIALELQPETKLNLLDAISYISH